MNGLIDRNKKVIKPRVGRKRLYAALVLLLIVGLLTIVSFFPEEEKQLRQEVRQAVVNTFPEEAAKAAGNYGLEAWADGHTDETLPASGGKAVVLIHGLDDPGLVWNVLAPALSARGFSVWCMSYPNDQPVLDSALLFASELRALKRSGIEEISIVSHSMGGLVSREVLSNPEIDYQNKVAGDEFPKVDGLVMVGTPNHGSVLARFRFFSEIRDQWVQMTENDGQLLGGWLDGAGEAKIDLLPGSEFLTTLNARPQPAGVRMLIIAGLISPWDDLELNQFLEGNLESETANEVSSAFKSVSEGLGDGLVSVESTRLPGIEHHTVAGNHLTMIRNLPKESERVPPSIPIIIEFLNGAH
jgi:pimeloyl-ACP methyl ester carboxylesterase